MGTQVHYTISSSVPRAGMTYELTLRASADPARQAATEMWKREIGKLLDDFVLRLDRIQSTI